MADALLPGPGERARKGLGIALRLLQEPGKATALAAAMGTSDSTISRIKTERLEECITLLAHLGLKLVPADYRCVDPEAFAFLTKTHERVMHRAPELIWEQDE